MVRKYFSEVITDKRKGFTADWLKPFLGLFSWIYGSIVGIRNFLYAADILHPIDLQRKVISVGNLTWGGTGKTPLVAYLAEQLTERGFKAGILTRGYMGKTNAPSDEAEMLARDLNGIPILIGADRAESARRYLLSQDRDVFILDDGFQHRQVKRNIDIVCIDASNPFGNEKLIPAGILREPFSSLKRANIIVLTKTDHAVSNLFRVVERIKNLNPLAQIVEAVHEPVGLKNYMTGEDMHLAALRGLKVAAFCSIGDAEGFRQTIKAVGGDIKKVFAFPDHHVYKRRDFKEVFEFLKEFPADALITTAKDEGKLEGIKDFFTTVPCLILKIKMKIHLGEKELFERIHHILGR